MKDELETPGAVPEQAAGGQAAHESEGPAATGQDQPAADAEGTREHAPETHEAAQGELIAGDSREPWTETESDSDSEELVIEESATDSPQIAETSTVLKAVIEAAIYVTDEPLTAEQIATATDQPLEEVKAILGQLVQEYAAPERGLSVREIAGGYKMSTKPEYHEAIRRFVKKLQPPLKLSLAALETLAVIAYKQPITGPEILEIRGVQGAGVVKTLLDRKLIVTAGRKNVLGKPMMYKTSRDFLVQFGLNSLAELPTLKEFEELGRMALSDAEEDSALLAANPNEAETVAVENETRESSEESVEAEQEADA